MGQLKSKRPRIGAHVAIKCSDVDGVRLRLLANLRLLGEHLGGVVVDIQQVDLEGAGATCWRHAYMNGGSVILYLFINLHIAICDTVELQPLSL